MAEYIARSYIRKMAMLEMAYTMETETDAAVVLRMIDDAPAADVAPVVHAEWVVCGDGNNVPWMCSHCGKTTAHKYKVIYGKYCPNCGAKMDGGADHV